MVSLVSLRRVHRIMYCSQILRLDIVCLSMSIAVVFGTGSLVC